MEGLENEKKDLLFQVGRISVKMDSRMTKVKDRSFKKVFSKSLASLKVTEESAKLGVTQDSDHIEANGARN